MHYGGAIGGCAKLANDLSEVVNGLGLCLECARHIEPGEVSFGVEKAVGSRPVNKSPDNLPNVVDAVSCPSGRARHLESGEAGAGVDKAVGLIIVGRWQQI